MSKSDHFEKPHTFCMNFKGFEQIFFIWKIKICVFHKTSTFIAVAMEVFHRFTVGDQFIFLVNCEFFNHHYMCQICS